MEELLKQLEFKHMTGPLWKHDEIGIISIESDAKPIDLVRKIYNRGHSELQVLIKTNLGIK